MTSRIYVIGDPATAGPVKIGTTRSLPSRLAAIKSGRGAIVPGGVNRAALEILYDYPGDRRLELELHRHYAGSRMVGEWFDIPAENAHNVVLCYLADRAEVGAVIRRGIACGCYRCEFQHPPEQKPGQRPELADPSRRLVAAVNAMTHARLGVDFADSHVALPASHCDIDRAVRLLETLDYHASQVSTPHVQSVR